MDPTISTLEQFNDPTQWVVLPNVPIFREHVSTLPAKKDAAGNPIPPKPFPVTKEELVRFASEMQRLEQNEGVCARITLGHTLTKDPVTGKEPREVDQPPLVGFARNAHVGNYGPKAHPGVLADFWIRRSDYERYDIGRQFPYRSPEVYLDARQITGVALLKRDPKLDMGMTVYQHESAPPVHLYEPKSYYERADGVSFYAMDDSEPISHYGISGLEAAGLGVGAGMDLASGRSATNTAGRAAGAFAGSRAGMALGAAGGPLGTIGGAIVGGLGGQALGDTLTKDAEPESPTGAQPGGQPVNIDEVVARCIASLTQNSRDGGRSDYGFVETMGSKIGEGLSKAGTWAQSAGGGPGMISRGLTDLGSAAINNPGTAGGLAMGAGGYALGKMTSDACHEAPKHMAERQQGSVAGQHRGAMLGQGIGALGGSALGGAAGAILSGGHPAGAMIGGTLGAAAGGYYGAGKGAEIGGGKSHYSEPSGGPNMPDASAAQVQGQPTGGGEDGAIGEMRSQLSQLSPEEFAAFIQALTEEYKQVHGAGGAAGGAPVAAAPEPPPAPPAAPAAAGGPPENMSRGGDVTLYARELSDLRGAHAVLQRQVQELQKYSASLEYDKIVAEREKALNALDRLGHQVVEKDFDKAKRYSREQWDDHVEEIKTNRPRHHDADRLLPIAHEGSDQSLPSDEQRAAYSRATEQAQMGGHRFDCVMQYMRDHQCEYGVADAAIDQHGNVKKK